MTCSQLDFNTRKEIVFIHYCACSNPPLVPTFNRMNPVRTKLLSLEDELYYYYPPFHVSALQKLPSLPASLQAKSRYTFLFTHSCK